MEQLLGKNESLKMDSDEFKNVGIWLVEKLAAFLEDLPMKRVTTGETPIEIKAVLGNKVLPTEGRNTKDLFEEALELLINHSLFNGHPRFWGYITSSAAPIGALAELLTATINANVGAYALSPMATEIERQTIKWLAELIGYNDNCGGIFVSGGNMANLLGFLAARKQKIDGNIRKHGLPQITNQKWPWGVVRNYGDVEQRRYTLYCGEGTHAWIHKAVDLFGLGTDSIRWTPLLENQQMNLAALSEQVHKDIARGHIPFMVIGNAGSVSTGAIDALDEISDFCKAHDLWFHIDGAYGAPAAALPELAESFKGLSEADSIAIDPHKWLYAPIEAGCLLVRNGFHLLDAFSFTPEYYNFGGDGVETPLNFFEYGMQNSRGFKALKVWLSLLSVGKKGIIEMIRKDIELSRVLFSLVKNTPRLEAVSQKLSIATFRYVPDVLPNFQPDKYINKINETLLNRLQKGGEVFISNAIVHGKYCLRACIVNFNTTYADLEILIDVVLREGERIVKEYTE